MPAQVAGHDQSPATSSNRTGADSDTGTQPDLDKNYGWMSKTDDLFRPRSHDSSENKRGGMTPPESHDDDNELVRFRTVTLFGGRLKVRGKDDDGPSDWWFASTAIPLLSATFAPMANMLSIAALVVSWRNDITDDTPANKYATSTRFNDPAWCLDLNGVSLACGFIGNIFLLCNFTQKIRYIIALPVTILFFYLASGILIGITIGMNQYAPPNEHQVYSQGYWHAIIAAILYMMNAMLLMANMLGYFLGHYPQHFDLNDEQRNLILQTMIFFLWLAGGAAVFSTTEGWDYTTSLYFCDVTLLTIGFGDFVATNDTGRGLVFPYTVGGTIILGLMVSSIHKFAQELSKEKVVKRHVEARRVNTLSRAVTYTDLPPRAGATTFPPPAANISRPLEAEQIQHDLDEKAKLEKVMDRTIGFHASTRANDGDESEPAPQQFRFQQESKLRASTRSMTTFQRVTSMRHRFPALLPTKSQKAILMYDEKDRFDRMRQIQYAAKRFKKWYALIMSGVSFGLLWCVGAMVFYYAEAETQELSYFQALYFCYVSLLTIGYGDLSPRSNSGKAFFVLWSLIAVPTMTILVSDLGDTAIGGFKRKVLEYGGLAFLGKGRGWGLDWFARRKQVLQRRLSQAGISQDRATKVDSATAADEKALTRRQLNPDEAEDDLRMSQLPRTIDELVEEELSEAEMARRLAYTLYRVADDMKKQPSKRYLYEEWVEFTRLIRFTKLDRAITDSSDSGKQLEYDEAANGLVEWDWLDSNSPMTSEQAEPEWVMDRLLESLLRTFRKNETFRKLEEHHQETRRSQSMSITAAKTRPSSQSGPQSDTGKCIPRRASRDAPQDPDTGQDWQNEAEAIKPRYSRRGQEKIHQRRLSRDVHPFKPHSYHTTVTKRPRMGLSRRSKTKQTGDSTPRNEAE